MGDTVRARAVTLVARVLGGERPAAPSTTPRTLVVLRDGRPYRSVAVGAGDHPGLVLRVGPGAYRLQLGRGDLVEGVSTPVWVEAVTPAGVAAQLAIGSGACCDALPASAL